MNETIKKFRRRIIRGAILRSLFAALIIASGVLVVSALASWIFGFEAGLWLSIGLFFATLIGAFLLFFFLKYRPTAKDVARNIDATGLEERLITMMELEGDDSYIARKQREDTQKALAVADHTLIKVAASVALCVAVGVSALLGVGALTVDSLYVAGVIPSGIETVANEQAFKEYNINYTVERARGKVYYWENNAIGEEVVDTIVVEQGEEAPAVVVVPEEGFAFIGWSDGVYDPYRKETGVDRNITVRAMFEAIATPDDLVDDGDLDPRDREPDPDEDQKDKKPDPRPDDEKPTGSHSNSSETVNDGNSYYGDEYNGAYQDGMDRLGDSDIPGNLQDGASGYLDSIGKGGSEAGGSSGGAGNTTP